MTVPTAGLPSGAGVLVKAMHLSPTNFKGLCPNGQNGVDCKVESNFGLDMPYSNFS